MKIVKYTGDNVKEIAEESKKVLQSGGIVVFPTETCYGVGVDATNQKAVDKVLSYKSRPEGKPISVAVTGQKMAEKYVEVSPEAENIYKNLLPGPVTVISKSKGIVASGIESENGNLGIRVPDHEIPMEIVRALGRPITSTSANVSGGANPYSVDQLLDSLSDSKKEYIDLIVDYGKLPKNPPSTVVDTTLGGLNVIRKGEIGFSQNMRELRSSSLDETFDIASELLDSHFRALREKIIVFLLDGELGAGKTHFTKGIAKHLKIKEDIDSPTYTVMNEYSFGKNSKLLHYDLWRLENESDLEYLKLGKIENLGDIVVIEWWSKFADRLNTLFSSDKFEVIKILIKKTEEGRELKIEG